MPANYLLFEVWNRDTTKAYKLFQSQQREQQQCFKWHPCVRLENYFENVKVHVVVGLAEFILFHR